MNKRLIQLLAVILLAGAGYGAYWALRKLPEQAPEVATAKVRKGDVVIRTFSRGELQAVRTVTLTAPNLFGTVQVTRLAPLGAFAREKNLIVEFDDSEVQARLEEKRLEIDQVDEQIKRAQADLAIRDNQDEVDLLRSRYSVRRAELEVKRNELLSQIDARKNLLNLEEARRRLQQLESDIKSRRQQAEAELAVLREQKNKAVLELQREQRMLSQVKLLAPMGGLVAVKQNRGAGMMFGMQVPDIREGDQVAPGTPVADILDVSEMEVIAKIGELDRANLHEGQNVLISLDAIPNRRFSGQIKSMSGTASANIFSGDLSKKFDVLFTIDMRELLASLGAKPEQVERMMQTAERNRNKPPMAPAAPSMMLTMGGAPGAAGGGMPGAAAGTGGGMPGMQSGPGSGEGSGSMGGQRGGWMARMQQMTPEQQQQAREAFQKALGGRNIQDLSPEERSQLFQKMRAQAGETGGAPGGASGASGEPGQLSEEQRQKMREAMQKELAGRNMQDLSPEERKQVFEKARAQAGVGGSGQGAATAGAKPAESGRPAAGPGAGGAPAMPFPFLSTAGGQQFNAEELVNAKLPPPPEEESQLEVLLRPGLLCDVEIIVEKIPNAIHIPAQALFEKDGKLVVYVQRGTRFDPRPVKLAKRSESTIVVAEGLQPGETIALADPTAKKGGPKKEEPAPGGGPLNMPSGGGRTGRS